VVEEELLAGLTFNESESVLSVREIDQLGYRVSYGNIKPDPERLRPLLELSPPRTPKELWAYFHTMHGGY